MSEEDRARELREQVDWALEQIKNWPEKEFAIYDLLPKACLCPECYLDGTDPQGDHWIVVLCPRATAMLTVYRQGDKLKHEPVREPDGKLYPDNRIVTDATAMWQTVMGLVQKIYDARERAMKAEGDRNGHDEGSGADRQDPVSRD